MPAQNHPRRTVSASEVGDYAWCSHSWWLRKSGAASSAEGTRRMLDGTLAHEEDLKRVENAGWRNTLAWGAAWLAVALVIITLIILKLLGAF